MFRSILRVALAPASLLAVQSTHAAAQQSDFLVSPFISFSNNGAATRFAGLALTLGAGSGLSIRGSGHLALNGTTPSIVGNGTDRPWAADADAVMSFGGHGFSGRSFAPFLFAGIGTSGASTQNYEARRSNWSYGAGANVPLAGSIDLFGESRWRMSEFVLPTAADSPSPTTEFRVGLTFHVGGGR